MTRSYPKEAALLRPHKESILEKNQAKRNKPKPQELNVASKDNQLQILENKRMNRKAALLAAMNKIHDPDIA